MKTAQIERVIPITDRPAWWEEDGEERLPQAVAALSASMELEQARRRAVNNLLRKLYRMPGSRVNVWGDGVTAALTFSSGDALVYNLIRSAVDTLAAKVAKTRPKATFTTTGGNWAQKRRALRMDRFVYGTFMAANAYRQARTVFRDAAVCDIGAVRGYVCDRRVVLERVDPDEIKVDPVDALYGKPRTLMHTRLISRHEAWRMWLDFNPRATQAQKADARWKVSRANSAHTLDVTLRRQATLGDVVEMHDVYRLPSREDAGDGRHVICLSNLTLLDEDWEIPRFPFAFMRIFEPDQGFYGQGVAELLASQQRTLNWMLRRMTRALMTMAVPRYWLPLNAKLNVDQLDTEIGTILRGTDKPEVMTGNVIAPEWFTVIPMTIRQGLEQVGISEVQLAATKPPGLNSGVAQRERVDIESERFSLVHQQWEDFHLDEARLTVDLARQSAKRGEPVTATAPNSRSVEVIDWEAAALDEGSYTLQVHSTSSLPATPTARRQFVAELNADGMLEPDEYRRLLQMPDVESSEDLNRARRDAIEAIIARLMDGDDDDGAEDDYIPPDPLMDLAYGMKHALAIYNQAVIDRAPEGRLDLLRRWINEAQDTMAAVQAAQQPQPGPGGAMPAGALPPGAAPGVAPPLAA